ncbi:unnamed protein product [Miscanthus lutarioriparius]|uniref:Ribosomal protein S2 n=1 Tax=Miscanthus lutarioriparius TaxID=422564 RepID=A0A811SMQ8_9POAL|nr:unnamed protein product [Miscanthus lutarioriparius]
MWSCINDSQWKIGAFLTNSYANPKKFRSRKNQINFGLNQQPDCVVILHPDRKSSVILEADRSLIPIASLVDSTIPCEYYKRINYPIPANDPIRDQQYYENYVRALDKGEQADRNLILAHTLSHANVAFWAQLGKAHQTAGVLFEVLCAVNKNEKVEEVNPEIIRLHKDVQEKKDIYAPFNTISSLSMPRVHPSPSCSWRRSKQQSQPCGTHTRGLDHNDVISLIYYYDTMLSLSDLL